MKSVKPKWQTWWTIAGPKLPTAELMLRQGIFIAPMSEDDFNRSKGEATPAPSAKMTSDSYVVRYPPRDVVQSRYRLQIDVPDVGEEEAGEHAREIANRLLASLSLAVPGGRYHAEFRKIRHVGENQEKSAWSQTIGITSLSDPEPLGDGDRARALTLYDRVESDETADNAYLHLLTAWQLQDTPGSKPLQRSVLQHYALCMEAIVTGVMIKVKSYKADQIKQAENKFIEEFLAELPNRANKPKAVREASTSLRMIGLQNTLPSIDMVAAVIGISNDTREEAKALYKFRSSSLSHPGRTNPKELHRWLHHGPTVIDLCKADIIARAFLVAYCDWDKVGGVAEL
ncbi:hypothetical protein [Sphingomonas abietis]|uniref:Apea-like HEPN domain-containing protein n=1 Tax=Sphingomonas abietis TaxID=3012344 RepID=A0ABY7NTT5_9SPHN|nr:hypothetical protein [Sphingomonas abietis]WBO22866.1 hypothetical protein PBT88_01585 [Sphingomonas abietis]